MTQLDFRLLPIVARTSMAESETGIQAVRSKSVAYRSLWDILEATHNLENDFEFLLDVLPDCPRYFIRWLLSKADVSVFAFATISQFEFLLN
jgi:hypothetical protein